MPVGGRKNIRVSTMLKRTFAILVVALILLQPCVSAAQSDYEFYFFGINLKAFKNSSWLMLTAGAVSSMLAHELGHALYLESQGKKWNATASSSGLAIHTNNHLNDSQYRNFGRAGFAFQAGIGAVLTSFQSTKHSDFTKGWVSMNAAQLWTYDQRAHDSGDDFALIEKGHGDKRLDFGVLALVSQNNLMAIVSPDPILFNMPHTANIKEPTTTWTSGTSPDQAQLGQHTRIFQINSNKDDLTRNRFQIPGAIGSRHQERGLLKSAISYLSLSPLFE